jgi:hypothetical protein
MKKTMKRLDHAMDYLAARKAASAFGGIPSNVLHDDFISAAKSEGTLESHRLSYPAWVSEIFVYPEQEGRFIPGVDVTDFQTRWRLPAEYLSKMIMEYPVFSRRVGLMVTPESFERIGDFLVVHPKKIDPVYDVVEASGETGLKDPYSRMPVSGNPAIPRVPDDLLVLHRAKGTGVRPFVRVASAFGIDELFADIRPDDKFSAVCII